MTPIRISGKNLGQLALVADFCPRCFWLRMHCQQRLPFQIFPGIFSSIDSFTKRAVNAHFDRYDRAPQWFKEFSELKELLPAQHHSRFCWQDPATAITLSGVPDELARRKDGTLLILDYKTSRFTSTQDSLLPLYRTQLNSYAVIAEKLGMGKVSGLALIYFEPQTDVDAASIGSVIQDDGFAMRFTPKVLPVALETEKIPALLARVREIFDLPFAPVGRLGCKDCRSLDGLVKLLTSPLPVEERERLEEKLRELRDELGFSYFEQGMLDEEVRAHRVELLAAEESNHKRDAEHKRLRLEIAAVERQLRGEAGGKTSG